MKKFGSVLCFFLLEKNIIAVKSIFSNSKIPLKMKILASIAIILASLKTMRLFLPVLVFLTSLNTFGQYRTEILLDKEWKFSKGDFPEGMKLAFNSSQWQTVDIPHDWAIYGPFDINNDRQITKIVQNGETTESVKIGRTGSLPYIGVGWYRKQFTVPEYRPGKKVIILFDGAMSNSKVYVNGKKTISWPNGYNSFYQDITDLLNVDGPNLLAVRLENPEQLSRWYPGAGLYRNVHLIIKNEASIKTWGTFISTPIITPDQAKVNIRVKLEAGVLQGLNLRTEILNDKGAIVANVNTMQSVFGEFEQNVVVNSPALWSPETPVLYTAITRLYRGDRIMDEYTTRFGIRDIKFEAGKGFSLNGQIRKLKGVCLHHDLGPLGTAINKAAIRRQLSILKDMGCDAIRTSHNMPAPELLDLCDEMGFMVMDEAFDEWKEGKMKNGYHLYFDKWAEKDMINMLHRDRNHPSVIMWSIGNEINEQSSPEGNKTARFLRDICHREDPTRLVTAGMDRADDAIKNNFAAVLDIPSFNYKPDRYSELMTKLPQGFILGSETASTVSSRGVYKFPVEIYKNKQYDDNQSSGYDLEACNWSQVPDDEFVKQDDLDYIIGEFVWTGFDYLGEPVPYDQKWPSRSSYFGIVDLAGIPKDRFYLYRSKWNPETETIHLLPHWNWPGREGAVTPVFCYTNYPSAELFLNGKSMGRQFKTNMNNQTRYRLMWNDVKYEPGTLKVVVYDKDGKVMGEREMHTAGKPHHLQLSADRTELTADGSDIAFVTIQVVDKDGNPCPQAANSVSFNVKGAGKYRAACNGNAASLQPFHLAQMQTFNGMVVALAQAGNKPGKMIFEAKSPGLNKGTLVLTCR